MNNIFTRAYTRGSIQTKVKEYNEIRDLSPSPRTENLYPTGALQEKDEFELSYVDTNNNEVHDQIGDDGSSL